MNETFWSLVILPSRVNFVFPVFLLFLESPYTVSSIIPFEKIFLFFTAFLIAFIEPVVQDSEERNAVRAKLYGYKHPNNVVPANFYIPGNLIDLSAPPFYYIYFALMPVFLVGLIPSSIAVYTNLGMFTIHIRGKEKHVIVY
uniref:Uncharacterized protein n=1 Tax=Cacopsylla melanoneura TaxID=428564 RepID=A0A8D8ZSA0_9HEMI